MVLKYNSISAREFVEREIPDGNTPLLFSGIGAFRGRTDYTQSEATVLDYFFTSTTSNVYAARDALPNELWALLMGQFARSNMTARDRVLKLFGDVHKKGARDGKSVPSIDEMARSIKSGGEMEGMILEVADAALALNSVDLGNIARRMGDLAALFDTNSLMAEHLRRSGVFIEEWGINYGHASLRDSGVIRLCIEGISQRSTKKVEAARQGAYQEQSTRALPFTIGNAGIPYEIRETPFEGILLQLNQDSITLYDKIAELLPAYLKHKLIYLRHEADEKLRCARGQVSKPVPDGIWNRVINEKVFDVARYLLPQNMTTSLGITLNARRFQDMLTEWQSDPLYEVRMIGRVAQAESIKISPVLMKHGNKSEFYEALPGRRKEVYDKLIGPVYSPNERRDISTKLSKCTPEIETMVLASILLNARPDLTYADLIARVRQMNAQDRILIAEAEMKDRKSYEALPKGAEVGSFVFERDYDIGAYRDLQRQRGDLQQCTPYGVIGFSMPEEIAQIGLEGEFLKLMAGVKQVHCKFMDAGLEYISEYIPLMANHVRHVVTEDPVQAFYVAKLRAQPAGAPSYRRIAQEETKIVLEKMPAFNGLVKYDTNHYELGRLEEYVQHEMRKTE